MRSNEFKGATLAEAVRNATSAYRRSHHAAEHKDVCTDLAFELTEFKREAARAEDRKRSAVKRKDWRMKQEDLRNRL